MSETLAEHPAADGGIRTHPNARAILLVVLSATFVQLLDVSIVGVAIPDIQQTLGASYGSVQLVLSMYSVGFAALLVLAARLGDIYGRRRLFLTGMALFTLTSVLCAAAPSIAVLVTARVLQGAASALMFSQVLAFIQIVFAPEDRAGALGAYGTTIGLGTILGPLAGGLLIQAGLFDDPWRAVFFVNVPIGLAALVAAWRLLPESSSDDRPSLDVIGALLSAAGLAAVIYPLSEGRREGWPAGLLALLAAGVALLVAFVLWERYRTRQDRSPILDTRLFADRSFRVGTLLNVVFYLGVPGFFYVFIVYVQAGEGLSALQSGLTTFAFALGAAITATNADPVARKLGNRVLALGCGLLIAGMLILILTAHLASTDARFWQFAPGMLLGGLGFGLFVPTVIDLVLTNVPARNAGVASGALATSQQVGGAVGVALIGILFFGLASDNAPNVARTSSTTAVPQLQQAGTPPTAARAAQTQFERCFVRQTRAKDPTATPPGCPVPSGDSAASPFARAATEANGRNYATTIQRTLLFEVAAFALAALLVLRLPKADTRRLDA